MRKRTFCLAVVLPFIFLFSAYAMAITGPPGPWIQVNDNGFVHYSNQSVYRMVEYSSKLYAGIWGLNGAQVWETSAAGGLPFPDWTKVNDDGFLDADNVGVNGMV